MHKIWEKMWSQNGIKNLCTVIMRNNGKINMASGKNFEAPIGAVINIESGEIN